MDVVVLCHIRTGQEQGYVVSETRWIGGVSSGLKMNLNADPHESRKTKADEELPSCFQCLRPQQDDNYIG